MIEIAWPWALIAWPLPWIYRRLLRPSIVGAQAALRVPAIEDFAVLGEQPGARPTSGGAYWLALIAWTLLLVAAARPQWLGEAIEIPISGRDLMLAVDLSKSMQEVDFILNGERVNRLTATKHVVGDFIDHRVGDRLGLILFGSQAYLHVPLTFDRATVKQLLNESVIGLAGPSTAIGDAIGLTVKRLRNNDSTHKVLILITDGANTAGAIEPRRAAELASAAGLTIHTIGIGADELMVRRLFRSFRFNPSRDLDEETLRAIAERTGGRYFRARDADELRTIYAEIDKLEPVERGGELFRPTTPLFSWPLALALTCSGFAGWLLTRR
ncbi:MAG: VWA domain-containing protein [Proteobacteria bacterium]|nr:MAG: VWA domain-containing protein [Pseudomonadota bacterium]